MAYNVQKLRKSILDAVVEGLRRNGERIFDISQRRVPVRTSFLQRSGYVDITIQNGVEIGYTADYARTINSGSPAIPYTGTQVIHKRAHTRRTKTGKNVYVKAHDVKYVNKRLLGFKPSGHGTTIFRVFDAQRERQGTFFFDRSITEGLKSLPEDLKFTLGKIKIQ